MSDQNAKRKSKYESPVIVPLGEMAKGSGACAAGSSVAGLGTPGSGGPYGSTTCSAGTSPVDYCSAGINATQLGASYCTAGTTAEAYCTSSGTTASLGACTTSGFGAGAHCSAGSAGA